MAKIEHQVWSVPPKSDKQVKAATYSKCRWQWAEKLYQYLIDIGHKRVEIRDIKT